MSEGGQTACAGQHSLLRVFVISLLLLFGGKVMAAAAAAAAAVSVCGTVQSRPAPAPDGGCLSSPGPAGARRPIRLPLNAFTYSVLDTFTFTFFFHLLSLGSCVYRPYTFLHNLTTTLHNTRSGNPKHKLERCCLFPSYTTLGKRTVGRKTTTTWESLNFYCI